MADFCKQCTAALFGEEYADRNDMVGLSTEEDTAKGLYASALCEGCGFIQVDHTGKCITENCSEHGHKKNCPEMRGLKKG